MGGIAAARGKFVIMGDADGSYDFRVNSPILGKLREGYDLVQGCRLPSGGGKVMPGAMPVLHRWIGNPIFSLMAQRWFHSPIQDIYCGMRGFTKSHYERLDQRCTGMEFATEMIIKSSLLGCKAAQVPITLHPDCRKAAPAASQHFPRRLANSALFPALYSAAIVPRAWGNTDPARHPCLRRGAAWNDLCTE